MIERYTDSIGERIQIHGQHRREDTDREIHGQHKREDTDTWTV